MGDPAVNEPIMEGCADESLSARGHVAVRRSSRPRRPRVFPDYVTLDGRMLRATSVQRMQETRRRRNRSETIERTRIDVLRTRSSLTDQTQA